MDNDSHVIVDIDDAVQLGSLIQSAMGESSYSAEEYIAGEDIIPVCADFDGEDWDENWLNSHSLNVDNLDSDTEEVDYDLLMPPPKLTCFKQAIEAVEDVATSILGTPRLC